MRKTLLAWSFSLATFSSAFGSSIPNGPFTTTQVCPQTNPTVGVTAQCQSMDGTTVAQTNVNANAGGGTFSGSALAKSQAGALGVSTSVTLNHYNAATNVFDSSGSAPNLARAQANWIDTLTLAGLPSVYNLTLTFNLDGSFSSNNAYFDSLLDVDTILFLSDGSNSEQSNTFEKSYYNNGAVPSSFTQTFTGLQGNTFQESFDMLATTDIPVLSQSQVPIYQNTYLTGTGSADFANTLKLATLQFTDSSGNQINNVSVSSADGYSYTVAGASPVPEPPTAVLCLTAMAALFAVARWRQNDINQLS